MITDFPDATKRVLAHEGGYGWNKKDKGGPTNFGITCYDYAEFRGQKMTSMEAWAPIVKAMPLSDAMGIYRNKYWGGMRCDELPPGVDYAVYDYGINSGVARPAHVAQALLNLPRTGKIDSATVAGLKTCNPDKLLDAICDERLQFMHNIRGGADWQEFGGGWGTRVKEVRDVGHVMIKASANIPGAAPAAASIAAAVKVAPPPTAIDPTAMARATNIDPQAGKGAVKTAAVTTAAQTPAHAGFHVDPRLALAAMAGTMVIGVGVYFYIRHRQAKADAMVILPPHLVGASLAA